MEQLTNHLINTKSISEGCILVSIMILLAITLIVTSFIQGEYFGICTGLLLSVVFGLILYFVITPELRMSSSEILTKYNALSTENRIVLYTDEVDLTRNAEFEVFKHTNKPEFEHGHITMTNKRKNYTVELNKSEFEQLKNTLNAYNLNPREI